MRRCDGHIGCADRLVRRPIARAMVAVRGVYWQYSAKSKALVLSRRVEDMLELVNQVKRNRDVARA
jgi:hypothetical protein